MDLIFDTPWWLPTLVIGVGVVLFVYGNKRIDATLRNVGLVVIVLALVLIGVSFFVENDVERVSRRTREMIASVNDRDWKKLESLLDPHTHFYAYRNRDQLIAGAKASVEFVGLKSARVISLSAKRADSLITVDVHVVSEQDRFPYPAQSSWRMIWQETADGWFLTEITALPSQRLTPDQIKGYLATPPK